MKEFYWINISEQKPIQGQWIFYLDTLSSDYYDSYSDGINCEDIYKGEYKKDNLVEYCYDLPAEEFKYWFPIPKILKEK